MFTWVNQGALVISARAKSRMKRYGRIVGMNVLRGASAACGTALVTAAIWWWQSR